MRAETHLFSGLSELETFGGLPKVSTPSKNLSIGAEGEKLKQM